MKSADLFVCGHGKQAHSLPHLGTCVALLSFQSPQFAVLHCKSSRVNLALAVYCVCLWRKSPYLCICAINVVQKNQRELAKMRKCLRPEELVSHMGQMDTQTQHEELEKSYQVVVEDYRRIIERIASQA